MPEAFAYLGLMIGLVAIMVVPGAIMRVRDIRRERGER